MADLKIRNVEPCIIEKLDELVREKNYASRNELVNEIITLYVTDSSKYFNKALLPTVSFLVKECLSEHRNNVEQSLQISREVNIKVLNELKKITEFCEE